MRIVMAMVGEKGAGKDTFATYFVERGFRRIAFADLLYQEAAGAYGVHVAELARRDLKEQPQERFALQCCRDRAFVDRILSLRATDARVASLLEREGVRAPLSPRFVLQYWGTEYRRQMVSDLYFVRPVEQAILAAPYDHFIITDVREHTEIAMTERVGGKIYKVEMIGKPGDDTAVVETISSGHSSEQIARAAHAPWCADVFTNVWGEPERLMQQAETLYESHFPQARKFAMMA